MSAQQQTASEDGPIGTPIVEARDLAKRFGGLRAVDGCSLMARSGRITGLIGPNGAGKSTLLAILAGAIRPDRGAVLFEGRDVTRMKDWQRARLGLIRTFQVAKPLGHMTVVENMLIGGTDRVGETFHSALFSRRTWAAHEEAELERAVELLRRFNLLRLANDYAETLSGGQLRLLELARALMSRPRLLLLDEPFAGVNPTLAHQLADHVEELKCEGLAMILIEHELGLVGRLCDPIVVMANGRVLATGSMDELSTRQDVLDAYLGKAEAMHENSAPAMPRVGAANADA